MNETLLCIAPAARHCQLRRVLPTDCSVTLAESWDEVGRLLAERPFTAAMADVDAAELHRLRALRDSHPLLPVLGLTTTADPQLCNALHALRIKYAGSTPPPNQVREFLRRAGRAGRLSSAEVDACVRAMVASGRLRPRDLQLMPVILGSESREEVMARLQLSSERMTRRMRELCRRFGARTPAGALRNLWRDALVRRQRRSPRDVVRPLEVCRSAVA